MDIKADKKALIIKLLNDDITEKQYINILFNELMNQFELRSFKESHFAKIKELKKNYIEFLKILEA